MLEKVLEMEVGMEASLPKEEAFQQIQQVVQNLEKEVHLQVVQL